jgi:hypothetical protein
MANPSRLVRRPWLRFSLAGLLLAVLWTCGTLAGYWNGYRHGYRHGGDAYQNDQKSLHNYRVRDMLTLDAQREENEFLIAEIREVIESKPARGRPRKPIEIWISPGNQNVSILAGQIEQMRAQAYFDTIRLSEGFESGSHDAAMRTRRLYPVQDLLSESAGQKSFSHDEVVRGLCTFLPKWRSSPPRSLSLSRGTLDVLGTPGDHRRVMLYLRALRAMQNPPCQG